MGLKFVYSGQGEHRTTMVCVTGPVTLGKWFGDNWKYNCETRWLQYHGWNLLGIGRTIHFELLQYI